MSLRSHDQVLLTYDRARPRRTELVLPVTVAEDSVDRTMLALAAGTPTRTLVRKDGSPIPRETPYTELATMERVLGDSTWRHTNVLICWQPQWSWDVRLMWEAGSRTFIGWYINIQDPMRRVPGGFDTTDHFLDIVVHADFTWELKDEAEFADATRLGMYRDYEVAAIEASVERAVAHLESRSWPFDTDPECFPQPERVPEAAYRDISL